MYQPVLCRVLSTIVLPSACAATGVRIASSGMDLAIASSPDLLRIYYMTGSIRLLVHEARVGNLIYMIHSTYALEASA